MKLTFFAAKTKFRAWLAKHHATANELLVGYYKKNSGKPSMTWPESVDEALCFGWIDGIRRSVDAESYCIRFTPRRPGSIWSATNIRRAEALQAAGQMQEAGLKAFAARQENKSGIYSYEQRSVDLEPLYAGMLRKNRAAWKFHQAQAPSYRKAVTWWIVSAKREETRLKRLQKLVQYAEQGARIPEYQERKKSRA